MLALSASQVSNMIEFCRQTFGNPAILDAQAFVLDQVILFPAETPSLHQSLEAWQQARKMRDTNGPDLSGPLRLSWRDTDASISQWREIVNLVYSAVPGSTTAVSPDYGSAGRPTPGRLVRLRLPGGDVPAVVHKVLDDSSCILVYAVVPVFERAMRDPVSVHHCAIQAPFGHEPESVQWDYWPRA